MALTNQHMALPASGGFALGSVEQEEVQRAHTNSSSASVPTKQAQQRQFQHQACEEQLEQLVRQNPKQKQAQRQEQGQCQLSHQLAKPTSSERPRPRNMQCGHCPLSFKTNVGGIICQRHRKDGTFGGCGAGICWRCMEKASERTFGRIRTTKKEFEALGESAWWMHERCMTSDDSMDYFVLMMPVPGMKDAAEETEKEAHLALPKKVPLSPPPQVVNQNTEKPMTRAGVKVTLSGLPAGWEARKARSSGKAYYVNKELGKTQWHAPPAKVHLVNAREVPEVPKDERALKKKVQQRDELVHSSPEQTESQGGDQLKYQKLPSNICTARTKKRDVSGASTSECVDSNGLREGELNQTASQEMQKLAAEMQDLATKFKAGICVRDRSLQTDMKTDKKLKKAKKQAQEKEKKKGKAKEKETETESEREMKKQEKRQKKEKEFKTQKKGDQKIEKKAEDDVVPNLGKAYCFKFRKDLAEDENQKSTECSSPQEIVDIVDRIGEKEMYMEERLSELRNKALQQLVKKPVEITYQ